MKLPKDPILVQFDKMNIAIDLNKGIAYVETHVPEDAKDVAGKSLFAVMESDYFMEKIDELYLKLAKAQNREQ